MPVESKTEIILRGQEFVRRSTEITEESIGDAVALLAKHTPKPINIVQNAFDTSWRGIVAPVHMIFRGDSAYAVIEVPVYGPKCVWRPMFSEVGQTSLQTIPWASKTVEEKAKFMADFDIMVEAWRPIFTANTPQGPFEKLAQANIPWNSNHSQMLFVVHLAAYAPRETKIKGRPYHLVECYCTVVDDNSKQMHALWLTNHYDNGKVCMGSRWNEELTYSAKHGSLANMVQVAVNEYNSTTNNADLHRSGMEDAWKLNYDMNAFKSGRQDATLHPQPISLAALEGFL